MKNEKKVKAPKHQKLNTGIELSVEELALVVGGVWYDQPQIGRAHV